MNLSKKSTNMKITKAHQWKKFLCCYGLLELDHDGVHFWFWVVMDEQNIRPGRSVRHPSNTGPIILMVMIHEHKTMGLSYTSMYYLNLDTLLHYYITFCLIPGIIAFGPIADTTIFDCMQMS